MVQVKEAAIEEAPLVFLICALTE
ncbi:uncharacterized protein METZ01_LOCUS499501 [marine metagenome]|uniref:Uncharacterized protein n=1 Tax=marine metagenome TaxID=408172 RepID=A0A383DQ56_9ZZZZ